MHSKIKLVHILYPKSKRGTGPKTMSCAYTVDLFIKKYIDNTTYISTSMEIYMH